jgi:hypothetical protein
MTNDSTGEKIKEKATGTKDKVKETVMGTKDKVKETIGMGGGEGAKTEVLLKLKKRLQRQAQTAQQKRWKVLVRL